MVDYDDTLRKLEELERALTQHKDAEVKNLDRLRSVLHAHTGAVCQAICALVQTFADKKVVILVEAEISALGSRARPEDVVAWIEGIGVLVVEVKSIPIQQIRRFENNVPIVVYQGHEAATVRPSRSAEDLLAGSQSASALGQAEGAALSVPLGEKLGLGSLATPR